MPSRGRILSAGRAPPLVRVSAANLQKPQCGHAGLLGNVKDLVDWGVAGDHTTPDELRLTVSARQAKAKELTAQSWTVAQGWVRVKLRRFLVFLSQPFGKHICARVARKVRKSRAEGRRADGKRRMGLSRGYRYPARQAHHLLMKLAYAFLLPTLLPSIASTYFCVAFMRYTSNSSSDFLASLRSRGERGACRDALHTLTERRSI
jgi:hypothetical protein